MSSNENSCGTIRPDVTKCGLELFENSPAITLVIDPEDGCICAANKAARTFYGYSTEKLLSLNIMDLNQLPPQCVKEEMESARREGRKYFYFRHLLASGEIRDVQVQSGTIHIDDKPFLQSIIFDVTGLKVAEGDLAKARDEAQRANKAKDVFLANISHELRTPLNGILGMLHLLEDTPTSADQQELIEDAKSSANDLQTVINDLLDYSLIETDMLRISPSTFTPASMLRSLFSMFDHSARQKGLELQLEKDAKVFEPFTTDSARLRQILTNLVNNAIKFTENGSVAVSSCIIETQNKSRKWLLVIVSDTGVGIPDKSLEAIFAPFTQVDGSRSRQYQGMGLGLAIVAKLLRLMDGSICITSEPGQGTSIAVAVPSAAPVSTARKPREIVTRTNYSLRVLVAEDNRVNRLTTTRFLEKLGHTVLTASSGKEAVSVAQQESFDCVLMDLQMPEMDGLEATRHIRRIERHATTPIIALTAHTEPHHEQRALDSGMNGLMRKPLRTDTLDLALQRLFPPPADA